MGRLLGILCIAEWLGESGPMDAPASATSVTEITAQSGGRESDIVSGT